MLSLVPTTLLESGDALAIINSLITRIFYDICNVPLLSQIVLQVCCTQCNRQIHTMNLACCKCSILW